MYVCMCVHGRNNFAEVSKNLDRHRYENNFVGSSKQLCRKLSMMSNTAKS